MDLRNWKRVLVLWMSEFDYTNKSTSNVEQSDVEAFFEHVRSNHKNLMQRTKKHVQLELIEFLSDYYGAFRPHVDDQNEMSSADYVYVYSLLLHFTCVKQPDIYFQEKCNKLPESAQKAIALFFKLILECPLLNKENLRHIIGEVASACQLKSSPTVLIDSSASSNSPASSPLKTSILKAHARISPSTPKTILLDERTRELISLRTELENERYEKSLLEIQIKDNETRITKLNDDCKRLQQKILDLKTTMNGNSNENDYDNSPSPSELNAEEQELTKRRLTRDIREKEDEISKLTDIINNLRDEKSTLKEKLNQAEKHITVCMDRIQESDCKIFDLNEELKEQSATIKCLNEHNYELERYIGEIRTSTTANNSSDCLDVSFPNGSMSATTSPENLGCSVIDKQLREKTNEVHQLKEEMSAMRSKNFSLAHNILDFMAMDDMKSFLTSSADLLLRTELTETSDAEEYLCAFGDVFKELIRTYKENKDKFSTLETYCQFLTLKNDELEVNLTKAHYDINVLETKVNNMYRENEDLKLKNLALNESKCDVVKQYESLVSEYNQFKENHEQMKLSTDTSIEVLKAKVKASEQHHERVNQSNKQLQNEINKLMMKLNDAQEESSRIINDHEQELYPLRERLANMEKEFVRQQSSQEHYEESIKLLKKKSREADEYLAIMRTQLNDKESEMGLLGDEIAEVRAANIEKEKRIEKLLAGFNSERERLKDKLKCQELQLEKICEKLKAEIKEKDELLVEREKELLSITNKLHDVSQTVLVPLLGNELTLTVEELGIRVRDVMSFRKEAEILIEDLRNDNHHLQQVRTDLESKVAKQKESFERRLKEETRAIEQNAEMVRKSKEEMCTNFSQEREHYEKMEKELKTIISKHNEAKVSLQKAEEELQSLKREKLINLENLAMLDKEKNGLRNLIKSNEKILEELREKLSAQEKDLSTQREKEMEMQNKLAECEKELSEKHEQVKQFNAEHVKLSKQYEQLEKENNANAEQLKISKEQLKVHKQQLEQLKKEHKQKLAEIKTGETERNNKASECAQLKIEHNDKMQELTQNFERRIKSQQLDIEHGERKVALLTEELEDSQRKIANIESRNAMEIEEKLSIIRQLENSLDKNFSTTERLKIEIEEKETLLKELKVGEDNLKKEINSLKLLHQNTENEIEKIQVANRDLTEKLMQQENKKKEEIDSLKVKLEIEQSEANKSMVVEWKKELAAATEKVQTEQSRVRQLTIANKELEKRLEAQEQRSKEEIELQEEKLLSEQDMLRHVNASLEQLKKRLSMQEQQAREEIDFLKEKLLNEQNKLNDLNASNDELRSELIKKENEAHSMRKDLNMERGVKERFKTISTDLKQQLSSLEDKENKVAALTAELQESQILMKRLDDSLEMVVMTLEHLTEKDAPAADVFNDMGDLKDLKICLNKIVHKLQVLETEKQNLLESNLLQFEMNKKLVNTEFVLRESFQNVNVVTIKLQQLEEDLHKKNNKLSKQLKESNKQLELSRSKVNELKERLNSEQQKVKDQDASNEIMSGTVEVQETVNKKLKKQLEYLKDKVAQLEATSADLCSENEIITLQLNEKRQNDSKEHELSEENARLRSELTQMKTKLIACESQQEQNELLQKDIEKYLEDLEKLGLDNIKYKEMHEAQTKRIEKLSLRLGETQARGDKLDRELNKSKELQAKAECQIDVLKHEIDGLKKESKVLREKLKNYESLQDQMVARLDQSEASLKMHAVEKTKFLEEQEELKCKLAKLEKQRVANEDRIHDLQSELITSENEMVRLKLENGALNSQLAEKQADIISRVKNEESTKANFEHELENLQNISHKVQLALEIAQKEKHELEQQLLNMRNEKSCMMKEHQGMLRQLQEARQITEDLCIKHEQALAKQERTISELQEQLLVKKETCDEMQEKITQLMSSEVVQQNQLSAELDHLRVRFSATEELLEKELQNTAQLRTDNQILQAKYAEAKQRLQDEHKHSEERIKENRLELEGKLEKMKMKMKTLYTEEITKMKTRQERETMGLKTENDKLTSQNAKYEEHTLKLSTQIMRLNESILEHQRQRALLSTKLKQLEEPEVMRFKRPSSMHVASLPPPTTSTAPSSNLGSNLKMEDEEGEIFNNTYLTDLKAGRMSTMSETNICPEELQHRNSLLPPHLRSTYAAQYEYSLAEDELKDGQNLTFDDSMSGLLTGDGTRKKISGATHYKRPGPPTPSKNGGRLSLGGNSEPPREILKEYNDGGSSTVKTPSRFGFFGSRFSMGKDENTPPKRRLSSMFKRK